MIVIISIYGPKEIRLALGNNPRFVNTVENRTPADKIIGIGSYASEEEARYYEALYAAKYGLPTVPFNSRPHQAISGLGGINSLPPLTPGKKRKSWPTIFT